MTRPSLNRSRAASGWQIVLLMVCAFVGLLLARPTPGAESLRLEALYGGCKQTLTGDGVWWNSAYPNNVDTTTSCWQLGVSRIETQYRSWDIGWRLAYVDFGTLRWQATYPALDSEQHTVNPNGEDCDSKTYRGCVNKGDHKQSTRGLSMGAIAEHKIGPVVIGGDFGLYIYNSKMSYTITSALGTGSAAMEGLGATPYLGATLRYGYFMIQSRFYSEIKAHESADGSACGDCNGVTNGPAWQTVLGIQIPLQ